MRRLVMLPNGETTTVMVPDSAYLWSIYQLMRADALAYAETGDCPRCKRGDDRLDERHSYKMHSLMDGLMFYCPICGHEVQDVS